MILTTEGLGHPKKTKSAARVLHGVKCLKTWSGTRDTSVFSTISTHARVWLSCNHSYMSNVDMRTVLHADADAASRRGGEGSGSGCSAVQWMHSGSKGSGAMKKWKYWNSSQVKFASVKDAAAVMDGRGRGGLGGGKEKNGR